LEYEKHDFESYFNNQKTDLNIPNTIYYLEIFYQNTKTELLNRLFLQMRAGKLEIPEFISNEINKFNINNYYLNENPILSTTLRIFNTLKDNTAKIEDIKDLINFINQHDQVWDEATLRTFNAYIRNLCVILLKHELPEAGAFRFELQKEHLAKGFLYYEGKLSSGAFLALVKNGLKFKQFEWTYQIIEAHENLIIGDNENRDYYSFAKALYLSEIKKFNEALEILPISFNESTFTSIARRLEIKLHYELKSELLTYKIDAYKMYVNRTLPKYALENDQANQLNFINIVIQLVNSAPNDRKRAEQILRRIQEKKQVGEKEWLIEKVKQLGGITE
jgi:hypothetical protein